MLLPWTQLQFIDDEVGVGVFATRLIPAGTIVWVQDPMDRSYRIDELEAMDPLLQQQMLHYSYMDHTQHMVLCWDFAKYFNHSCEANCLGLDFPFEVAVRDIEPGEQLTDDYATFYASDEERFMCRCEAPSCRHIVSPRNRDSMMAIWQAKIATALSFVREVPQPLMGLLPPGELEQVISRLCDRPQHHALRVAPRR